MPVGEAADRLSPPRQCTQLQLVHHRHAKRLQLTPLGFRKLSGLFVHHAQRADGGPVLRDERSPCVELQMRVAGDKRIGCESRVKSQVRHDHDFR